MELELRKARPWLKRWLKVSLQRTRERSMTSRGIITSRTVYRCGGQLTLVYQYDVFFSCLYASYVVREKRNRNRKECDVFSSV